MRHTYQSQYARSQAAQLFSHDLLSPEDEHRLLVEKCALQRKHNKTAADKQRLKFVIGKLVSMNVRLIYKTVKKYETDYHTLEREDLEQEALAGLIIGVKKFDASMRDKRTGKPLKLSTYVTWWIWQGVGRACNDQGRTIRIPIHIGDKSPQIKRFEDAYHQKNGKYPTIEQVARHIGSRPDTVELVKTVGRRPYSLDTALEQDDSGKSDTLGSMMADPSLSDPLDGVQNDARNEALRDALNHVLDAREQQVLLRRFGISTDGESQTLSELGKQFGLTRERVRQIQNDALAKLRRSPQATVLQQYYQHI